VRDSGEAHRNRLRGLAERRRATRGRRPPSRPPSQPPAAALDGAGDADAGPAASSPGGAAPLALALPPFLVALLDPAASVDLPPGPAAAALALDNRELDKLVAGLGRSRATWRRALMLHAWLLAAGHTPDDRLCTTLLRVAAQHGAAVTALGIYDWMRAPVTEGGAALAPTVFTYTAAMRAALGGGLVARALAIWDDAAAGGCVPDCRMATALVEAAARAGDTDRALAAYRAMRAAPPGSRLAPSVHAYTAAMRAAAEGGRPDAALAVWDDMAAAGVRPTGHAYAAAISAASACADADPPPDNGWRRAASLFDDMLARGVKADVVSCTALVGALAAAARSDDAGAVVRWMVDSGVRPNVRTYTALLTAHAAARRWDRALDVLASLKRGAKGRGGGVEPNAYTYSALIKAAGEQGLWQLAEAIFGELEAEALAARRAAAGAATTRRRAGLDGGRPSATPLPAAAARVTSVDYGRGSLDGLARALAEQVLDGEEGGTAAAAPRLRRAPPTRPPCPPVTLAAPPASLASAYSWAGAAPATAGAAASAAADARNPWGGGAGRRPADAAPSPPQPEAAAADDEDGSPLRPPPLNEVVCGALMAAYERAGRCDDALAVLARARAAGVPPNVVMHNTALAALGRRGRFDDAAALFASMPAVDAVSHETLVAAAGVAGRPDAARDAFDAMLTAGHPPGDHAWCGLVAAHAAAGDARSALAVAAERAATGAPPSTHFYNALLAACERAGAWDDAVAVAAEMRGAGATPDAVTGRLLTAVASGGVARVEDAQRAAAALSAALAAAGGLLIRSGVF